MSLYYILILVPIYLFLFQFKKYIGMYLGMYFKMYYVNLKTLIGTCMKLKNIIEYKCIKILIFQYFQCLTLSICLCTKQLF